MPGTSVAVASKVPEVTLAFWIIKIAATTLGETGGDTVTMTLNWGYLAGTALFLGLLVVLVVAQILTNKFHPFLYWTTIVASTTFGTTMADFADRSLGIGYTGGSTLLFGCLIRLLSVYTNPLSPLNGPESLNGSESFDCAILAEVMPAMAIAGMTIRRLRVVFLITSSLIEEPDLQWQGDAR